MLFYSKFFIKYITLASAIWITFVLISIFRSDLNDENELNQKIIEQIVDRAKEKQKITENTKKSELVKNDVHIKPHDFDHPQEELVKAEKQKKDHSRLVQLNFPMIHNSNSPGELGKAVLINKASLSPQEQEKFNKGWNDNAFNQYVSDLISLHRTLPDFRDPDCKVEKWFSPLPTVSVIIIFHNEAWSTLLRTVHSILDRSDSKILKQVILVDDYSDQKHLKEPLTRYVETLRKNKVKLVRTVKREGLIRARLLGVTAATSDVLVFLDSHCECTDGWLEPLIDPIARNPNVTTVPIVEVIDDNTFNIHGTPIESVQIGGFEWNLMFDWHVPPRREMERRKSKIEPIRSPTMPGGLFAISRKYFELLGAYDPGMDYWGGENMEISFKVWMCGGEMVFSPCSHVGHVFRQRSPITWPKDILSPIIKNTMRVAEVWLDDEKSIFYDQLLNKTGNYGDISKRKQLREKLQCKSFDWYLRNVYPEQFLPSDSIRIGEIKSKYHTANCLDSNDGNGRIQGYKCHGKGGDQIFYFTDKGEIRTLKKCLDFPGSKRTYKKSSKVAQYECHGQKGNQLWSLNKDDLIQHSSGLCLEILDNKDLNIVMSECNPVNERQKWEWKMNTKRKFQSHLNAGLLKKGVDH